jgi:hypothetical protein
MFKVFLTQAVASWEVGSDHLKDSDVGCMYIFGLGHDCCICFSNHCEENKQDT